SSPVPALTPAPAFPPAPLAGRASSPSRRPTRANERRLLPTCDFGQCLAVITPARRNARAAGEADGSAGTQGIGAGRADAHPLRRRCLARPLPGRRWQLSRDPRPPPELPLRGLRPAPTAVQAHPRGPDRLRPRARRDGAGGPHRRRPAPADLPAGLARLQRGATDGEASLPGTAVPAVPWPARPGADWPGA